MVNILREKIGYMREIIRERIGRIRPKDEVTGYGYKVKVKDKEE